jgi:hypothetical protein
MKRPQISVKLLLLLVTLSAVLFGWWKAEQDSKYLDREGTRQLPFHVNSQSTGAANPVRRSVWRCAYCDERVVLNEDEQFPSCGKNGATTLWTFVQYDYGSN